MGSKLDWISSYKASVLDDIVIRISAHSLARICVVGNGAGCRDMFLLFAHLRSKDWLFQPV